jgi:hypothetical protein
VLVLGVEISSTYLSQEPCDQVAKDDGFVGLRVAGRRGDTGNRPQIALPLVEVSVGSAGVEQEHAGSAINQPSAVQGLDAPVGHRLDGGDEGRVFGFYLLDLDGGLTFGLAVLRGPLLLVVVVVVVCCGQGPYRIFVERSQQCVCRAILGRCHLGL